MIDLFPVRLYKNSIYPTAEENENTAQLLKNLFSKCQGNNKFPGESGVSTGELGLNLHKHEELNWLVKQLNNHVEHYWKYGLFYEPRQIEMVDCWANLHKKNDSTAEHCHMGGCYGENHVSGVYYFRKPKDHGHIEFCNPLDSILRMTPAAIPNIGIETIGSEFPAKQYDVILFPSWLKHRVKPHPVDEIRIAISFNYQGKK
jgi:uncharacterized protein (TIGR02466 family)